MKEAARLTSTERAALGNRAKRRVDENFTLEKMTDGLEAGIAQVLVLPGLSFWSLVPLEWVFMGTSLRTPYMQVFARLQCQLDVVTAPMQPIVGGTDTPLSSTDASGLLIQLKDTESKDEEIAHLKETLEKEKEGHGNTKQDLTAMSEVLVQLRDEIDVYQRRTTSLEKEKEEMALKLEEQEATIQAFGKPRIPLSRSWSATSPPCADSERVSSSSSGMSTVSPVSSERELAFSTFSTLALRRQGHASPASPIKAACIPRVVSLTSAHTEQTAARLSSPQQRLECGERWVRVRLSELHDSEQGRRRQDCRDHYLD